MAPNLRPGTFRTVSLVEGNPPVGVGYILPGLQFVYLNAPVAIWEVRQVGANTYRLSVGGYRFTGVVDNKVAASIFPEQEAEWIATYRELQDAYTIEQVVNGKATGKGWTAPYDRGGNAVLTIQPIISFPPSFLPTQLFKFEPADE